MRPHRLNGGESGQATTEYILILAAMVAFFVILRKGVDKIDLTGKLSKAVIGGFAATYKYGASDARGFDEGDPNNHPRILTPSAPSKNFRIFINPAAR